MQGILVGSGPQRGQLDKGEVRAGPGGPEHCPAPHIAQGLPDIPGAIIIAESLSSGSCTKMLDQGASGVLKTTPALFTEPGT